MSYSHGIATEPAPMASARRRRKRRASKDRATANHSGDSFEIAVSGLFSRLGIPIYDYKDWCKLEEKPVLAFVRQHRFPTPMGFGKADAVLFLPNCDPIGFEFKTQRSSGSTDVKLRELPFRCAVMPWSRVLVIYDFSAVNHKLIREVVAGVATTEGLKSHIVANTQTDPAWRKSLLASVEDKMCWMLTRRRLRLWIQINVLPLLKREGYMTPSVAHNWKAELDDVPQIGSLDTLLQVAQAMDGKSARVADIKALINEPELNSGRASHYRASAILAGLVIEQPDGICAMTPEAHDILNAKAPEDRTKHWRSLFLCLPMPQRVLAWIAQGERTRAALADYIYTEFGLSHSNATVRAGALLTWLRSAELVAISDDGILIGVNQTEGTIDIHRDQSALLAA